LGTRKERDIYQRQRKSKRGESICQRPQIDIYVPEVDGKAGIKEVAAAGNKVKLKIKKKIQHGGFQPGHPR
jgi:hypothetical protein